MSNKVKFVLNKKGVSDLMKSKRMQEVLDNYAKHSLSKLGDGYSSSVYVGKNRANVSINAESLKAKKENLENNTLLKAIR